MDVDRYRHQQQLDSMKKPNWSNCLYCKNIKFKQLDDFTLHLRTEHCTVEGGSFVCRYGYNSVCNSLPVEGVSDLDYADHIIKHHAFTMDNATQMLRKQSTASEKSVMSLASDPSSWMMVSASQNLAAVLNDPNRGKQKDFFTKLWGVDFIDTPLANILPNPHLPLVTRTHFETYLRKISKRHRRHDQLKVQLNESQQFSTHRRRQRMFERRIEPLDIPSIFLQADFDLSQPSVFYTAMPFARNGITVDGNFRQNSKILQEKLTQSMDHVEMRIAEQVSEKSQAFFAAMTSHDTLMDQLGKTLTIVRNLRSRLKMTDETVACQAFRALRLQQKRMNHLLVLQKLKLMRTVHQTQPQIQILLSAPDYVAALELIVTSQEILEHELSTVHCFRHLGPQLSEITRLIDKMMATEFETYSSGDLNRPLNDDYEVLEQEKLICIMLGMMRRGNTAFIGQYQTEAYTAIRALVKQVALQCLADSDCEAHGPYIDRVQSLPLPYFFQLMDIVTSQLAKLLRKIKGVYNVMKDTIDMAAGVKSGNQVDNDSFSFLTGKESEKANAELQKMLNAVCAFAHEECAKLLINVPALDNANASQFGQLGKVVERFCQDCVDISGRGSAALRGSFQSAAGRFLLRFHQERKERLAAKLDTETWKACDALNGVQAFITTIVNEGRLSAISDTLLKADGVLVVDDEKFVVVGSVVEVIRLIADYAMVARQLSLVASHLLRDLVELLNLFNSRSCQLVLGAGALQSARLKTITTTNLVLTSRSLQLLIWFLPHIRNHFDDVLISNKSQKNGKTTTVNLLDEVEKNMLDHIGQLDGKVVLIVSTVVANELHSWTPRPPIPSLPFRNVSRHLRKLHEAVSNVLPGNQVEKLYRKINDKFLMALREQLVKLNIVNNGGPQHGFVTSELLFYMNMLKNLNVLPSEELSDSLTDDIWPAKPN